MTLDTAIDVACTAVYAGVGAGASKDAIEALGILVREAREREAARREAQRASDAKSLVSWLKLYGRHTVMCPAGRRPTTRKCNCGFWRALDSGAVRRAWVQE